jgi:spore coat polysaccharide biosynthesis predicted glycosyltransferase SpsG
VKPSKQILLELDARFVFRVDASPAIGVGHVMRCVAIAESVADLGFETVFVGTTSEIGWVEDQIDSVSGVTRATSELDFTISEGRDVLIIDSYEIEPESMFINDTRWLAKAAIVDSSTPDYIVDIYIHPGPNFGWNLPNAAADAKVLIGTQYIPIRKSISELKRPQFVSGNQRVITIVAGGTDPTNFIEEFVPLLESTTIDFDGRIFTSTNKLIVKDSRFSQRRPDSNLEASFLESDIVFTTGGTTAWEVASLGIPMGIAQAVENQYQNYKYFSENNLAVGIGSYSKLAQEWNFNLESIFSLISSEKANLEMVENQLSLSISHGSQRIVSDLIRQITLMAQNWKQ